MFQRKSLQATNPFKQALRQYRGKERKRARADLADMASMLKPTYPTVPAGWPNRATRRAVTQNRMSRVSGPWRHVLAQDGGNLRRAMALL